MSKKIFDDKFLNLNKKSCIAIGLIEENSEILASLKKISKYAEIILVGSDAIKNISKFKVIIDKNPEERLAMMLANSEVDGIIRGTLDGFLVYENYEKLTGEKYSIMPALLEDPFGRQFFLDPTSNPDGWSREERLKIASSLASLINDLGLKPKIAVLTGERHKTYLRRKSTQNRVISILNKTYEDAEWIVDSLKKDGINAENLVIDLNVAISDNYNIIIPVNGMVGNQISRTILSCGGKILAMPRLGLSHPYEETSRTEDNFESHVKWLVNLINTKNQAS